MWKVRRKSGDVEISLAGETLLQRIFDGLFSEQYEFLAPGQTRWVGRQAALDLLMSRGASPVAQPAAKRETPAPVTRPAAPSAKRPDRWATEPAKTPTVLPKPAKAPAASPQSASPISSPAGAAMPGTSTSLRDRCARSTDDIEADFDMTPMIDVVFQLLIFFMVAGSIAVISNLQLPKAKSGATEDPSRRVVLVLDLPPTIKPPENGGALMMLDEAVLFFTDERERKLSGDQLEEALTLKFADHKQKLSAAGAAEAGQPVQFILLAHKKAPARLVRQILTIARNAGAEDQLVGVSAASGGK